MLFRNFFIFLTIFLNIVFAGNLSSQSSYENMSKIVIIRTCKYPTSAYPINFLINSKKLYNYIKRFKNIKGFNLINRDILSFDINTISEGEKSIRIAGNLPYNLSSPILEWSIKNINTIIDMHFMLQKEFAERCAGNENSKSYGKLSVICDYLFEVSILKDVDKSFFIPPPKVDSAFVRFKPKRKTFNEIEFVNLKKILNPLFNAKRKKIKKTLLSLFSEKDLESTGINLNLRPDELNTATFIKLSKLIKNNG